MENCQNRVSRIKSLLIDILSDEQVVADTFNNYFNNVRKLLILTNKNYTKKKTNGFNLDLLDTKEAAISKYKDHSSLDAIKGNMSKLDNPIFSFEYTSLNPTAVSLL